MTWFHRIHLLHHVSSVKIYQTYWYTVRCAKQLDVYDMKKCPMRVLSHSLSFNTTIIYCIEKSRKKRQRRERERYRYLPVNSDDCHSNTNKTSSVLFISTLNVVDYSTLNAGVQCINDMQMIKETERRKDKIRLLFHYSYMYTYCDERRETETERRLTLFLSRITD
jgi:hypothetical protein